MEVFTLPIWKTSTCTTLPSPSPDLTAFCRLDELGLIAIGQYLDMTARSWSAVSPSPTRGATTAAPRESRAARPRGVSRTSPSAAAPRRFWFASADTGGPAAGGPGAKTSPRAKLSRRGARWALEAVVVDHLSISRVAAGLGVSWHTANDAVIDARRELLIDDETRLDGVTTIGVDEHV